MMAAAEKAEGFGEAAILRAELGRSTEMPFSNPAGDVTGIAKELRKQFLGCGQSLAMIVGIEVGIVLVTEALLVTASEEASAAGTAERVCDIAVAATKTGTRKMIEVRCWNVF